MKLLELVELDGRVLVNFWFVGVRQSLKGDGIFGFWVWFFSLTKKWVGGGNRSEMERQRQRDSIFVIFFPLHVVLISTGKQT